MGTVKSQDVEINKYLPRLNTRQKETLLTVAKTFAEEHDSDNYDAAFLLEMDRRFKEMRLGKVNTYSFEDVAAHAKTAYHAKKN